MIWKAVPLRFYIYAGIAALIGYLMWREHSLSRKLSATKTELAQSNANYTALRSAYDHERKIANDATNEFQRTVKALEAAKADTPVRSVRLCRSPTGYVPAPSPAPSGAGPGADTGLPEAAGLHPGYGNADRWGDAGPDIGPQLYAEADRANELAARCNALIKWVGSR